MSDDICFEQKQRTRFVEGEMRRAAARMEKDKVSCLFQLQVYAFPCTDRRHEEPSYHSDYCAGGGSKITVPGATETIIKALEHCLAELKKRTQ